MAIQFARVSIISANTGSAVGKSAYIDREKRQDELTGKFYDFRAHKDLYDSGLILPYGAPEWANDIGRLWNEAQRAELVKDRKTSEMRFSKHGDPQVAKDVSLALPRELTQEQNRELLHGFVKKQFGERVTVQWVIHVDGENHNPHAHLLVSTRELNSDGFGKKVRDHNPIFFGGKIFPDQFARQWAEYQNEYFSDRGMHIKVDPTRIVADRHLGNARFVEDNTRDQQREALAVAAKEAALDPERLIEKAIYHKSTFTSSDLMYHMQKAGLDETERSGVLEKVSQLSHLIALEGGRYTTSLVIDQETSILSSAEALSRHSRLT